MAFSLEGTFDISEQDTASVFGAEQQLYVFLNIDKHSPEYMVSVLRKRPSSIFSYFYFHCDVQYYTQKRAI